MKTHYEIECLAKAQVYLELEIMFQPKRPGSVFFSCTRSEFCEMMREKSEFFRNAAKSYREKIDKEKKQALKG